MIFDQYKMILDQYKMILDQYKIQSTWGLHKITNKSYKYLITKGYIEAANPI